MPKLDAPIPKVIHFIWVGGSVPNEDLKQILKLAEIAKRSGFELNLWVDNKKNFETGLQNLRLTTEGGKIDTDLAIRPENLGIKVRLLDELDEKMKQNPFYQTDHRLRDFQNYVRREMVGLKNLAAAADFLRYAILLEYGGYYFDCDTLFRVDINSKLKEESCPLGIRANVWVKSVEEILGGNDIIAALPHHPAIEFTIIEALDYYQELLDGKKELEGTTPDQYLLCTALEWIKILLRWILNVILLKLQKARIIYFTADLIKP